ncbi:MAG: CHASE2 domain-containing protein [Flavobacteriales bacterium]
MPRGVRRFVRWVLRSVVLGLVCWASAEAAVYLSNRLAKPPLRGFENQLTDLAFQTRTLNPAFTDLTPDDVVIIDIDDASIAELGRPQQWPRLYDARAIAHVAAGNPFAIGIDYLYTEADSLLPVYGELLNRSGFSRADSILSAMRTDDSLAIAIRSAGNVYLALFDNETGSGNSGYAHLRRLSAEGETLKNAPILNDPVLPHTPFAAAARANGTIAMPSENDGTVRYYQLVSQAGDGFVANFPFYMVTDAFGFTDEELSVGSDGIYALDKLLVPLRADGSFRINWGGAENSIRYISFYKVVQRLVPPEFFENKFVFFGTSASGMQDLKTVPPRFDKMPGVEVHVHAFLTLVNRAWLDEIDHREARLGLIIAAIVLAGLMLVLRPLGGFLAAIVLIGAELFGFVLYAMPVKMTVFPIVTLMIITLLAHIFSALYIYFVRERNVRKLRNAFAAYVPREVVKKIAAETRQVQLGGQRMELAVLFSDIRGFTSYSEGLEPEAVVAFLNDYLSRMTEVIFTHKGTIDKFIGDAVMAIFGAPLRLKNSSANACDAALGMLDALNALNEELTKAGKQRVEIGIGINTGDMTVGNIGSRQRFSYTVIGDAVNVAARLESLTKFFGQSILVSEETARQAGLDRYRFRLMGPVRLQGRSGATRVYALLPGSAAQRVDSAAWEAALEALEGHRFTEARERLEAFLAVNPDDIPAQQNLARCTESITAGETVVFTPSK